MLQRTTILIGCAVMMGMHCQGCNADTTSFSKPESSKCDPVVAGACRRSIVGSEARTAERYAWFVACRDPTHRTRIYALCDTYCKQEAQKIDCLSDLITRRTWFKNIQAEMGEGGGATEAIEGDGSDPGHMKKTAGQVAEEEALPDLTDPPPEVAPLERGEHLPTEPFPSADGGELMQEAQVDHARDEVDVFVETGSGTSAAHRRGKPIRDSIVRDHQQRSAERFDKSGPEARRDSEPRRDSNPASPGESLGGNRGSTSSDTGRARRVADRVDAPEDRSPGGSLSGRDRAPVATDDGAKRGRAAESWLQAGQRGPDRRVETPEGGLKMSFAESAVPLEKNSSTAPGQPIDPVVEPVRE